MCGFGAYRFARILSSCGRLDPWDLTLQVQLKLATDRGNCLAVSVFGCYRRRPLEFRPSQLRPVASWPRALGVFPLQCPQVSSRVPSASFLCTSYIPPHQSVAHPSLPVVVGGLRSTDTLSFAFLLDRTRSQPALGSHAATLH